MHLETLTQQGQKIFQKLKNFSEFHLAGGTALALQIGHRRSIDFDLFSKKNISPRLLNKIEKIFPNSNIDIIVNRPEQLSVNINQVKLDFIKYPFPLISKLIKYQGVAICSIVEICAMKAYALGRRPALKDYIDLYYALKEKKTTLEKIIKTAKKKYKREFNARLFLEQLVYTEDVADIKIKFIKKKKKKKLIQKFFNEEIKKLAF